ncbi:hypothetical protein TcWFU_009515 [Taenia crassiceps]|uniref:Uncharacterized protein n=1 Tax=Taenia crassiceps TaxID=6207 RepID=A0ABR4QU21_9CEST
MFGLEEGGGNFPPEDFAKLAQFHISQTHENADLLHRHSPEAPIWPILLLGHQRIWSPQGGVRGPTNPAPAAVSARAHTLSAQHTESREAKLLSWSISAILSPIYCTVKPSHQC